MAANVTKGSLVDAVAKDADISKKAAGDAVNSVIETITKNLKKGTKVAIPGFGTFQTRKRKARKGRNPQTGEKIQIAAAKVPAFTAGKGLKDAVNGRN
ncbi:MAG: HU family DNA-binding protein [Lentisphaeria bacterium]|jgi:DNA-binding protein HU-beta|nr:HU family DNA-binding protein [Lentisphaeria bacterium]